MNALILIATAVGAIILIRVWSGVLNMSTIDTESLAAVEKKHPYLPKMSAIVVTAAITVLYGWMAFRYGSPTIQKMFGVDSAWVYRTVAVFLLITGFGAFDRFRWHGQSDRYRYFFAFVLGTVVTWILIGFKRAFFETGIQHDPFLMALGIVCVVIGWKFLFGPWKASMKATVLGTFIFWVAYAILRSKTQPELVATGLATIVAIIPVIIWCRFFLKYHRENLSVVLLAFFAGMLSTVPILFYDALMKHGIQLNFFLFTVTPTSFGTTSGAFVRESMLTGIASGVKQTVATGLVTYLIVGTIEEVSKYWVLRHSSDQFFRSVDDTLQLAIIVALGFAFAENLVNPNYFIGFVQQYLLSSSGPYWGMFLSNVLGRAVLTTMVHVLSTGTMGYFFGLAFFAAPLLRDEFSKGKLHPVIQAIHHMLDLKSEAIYHRQMLIQGILAAILIHGLFDFSVSLPDLLPGNPSTIGELIGSGPSSILNSVPLVLIMALLYVFGGCWLLTTLFSRKQGMKEYGQIVETQTVVL